MSRTLTISAALLLTVAPAAKAGEWERLLGPQVRDALTGRVLAYDNGAMQDFLAGGRTLYTGDGPAEGRWRIDGDRYCSVWPPSDRWTCFDVDRHARGLDIRFTADDGSATIGRYNDLQ